ncbi:patatin [Mycolicibacterium conceptionense]|jgi:NTE family protein|uniref:Patatin n=2 Tax=Mycolicibacterium TaxID=1866885 RepID=A0ABR5FNT7_9MYCO|nr:MULTISPECIES: patatin-like phospholipase family protein [Mycolicibacterium]KLI08806.1 patatin [Mycolicibacterium senegalense]KLO48497.1 patatin [Mycolicibacterium senegalense]KMV20328.1 patatin [Mycolicibacterium conceptionense]OBJ93740.1 patatin [Mycolicibacterium conceptionense]OMB90977.1 patatin [Mycolicibacterium conceptionense]
MTTALVIGCGGTIGGAWTVAALHALAEETGWDPREASVLQGTSAGAELVTMLGGGAAVADLVAMQRGTATDERLRRHITANPPSLPPIPLPRLLNPRLLGSQKGLAAATGIAPVGRGNADWLQRLADGFSDGTGWLPHPGVRMVAFDYQRGQRVAFGAPGAPAATAGAALRASWAVPGWMPPVTIDDRHFVDGGAASTASVDLIAPEEAETVYVITPMASEPGTRAPGLGGRLEHLLLRRPMSVGLDREVAAVRARGTHVVVIRPDAADLVGLGSHFMRRGRRRSAFEASMRTAPATVRRALALSEEAR